MTLFLCLAIMLGQSAPQAHSDLDGYSIKMVMYMQDFQTFASAHDESPEREICNDLFNEVDRDKDIIDDAKAFSELYHLVSHSLTPVDRAKVKLVVAERLIAAEGTMQSSAKAVTTEMSFTQLPAVAQEAARLRDDLRKLATILDAEEKRIAKD